MASPVEAARDGRGAGGHIVACTIEAEPSQFVGALILWLSLGRIDPPAGFRLCIVERGPAAAELLEVCAAVGVTAATSTPVEGNRFLNKWLVLDAFRELREASRAALLDWDTLLCTPAPLPAAPAVGVLARRNPTGIYRDLIRTARPLGTPLVRFGRVRCSINAGVLIGSGPNLRACGERAVTLVHRLERAAPDAQAWQVEQLATSIAAGEIGPRPLPRAWNVTPQSRRVPDRAVRLWHYNDGVPESHALKRCLDQPALAQELLRALGRRWPTPVATLAGLHGEVLGLGPVAPLLRREP